MSGDTDLREDGADASGAVLTRYDDTKYSVHAVHLVRTSMTVNMALSQMADQKASILMGATFVVFSIAIGQVTSGSYQASLLILALSAFVSATFAVAAIVPKIITRPPDGSRSNPMFFGVFAHMSEDDFIDTLMRASETDGRVLSTMLRDIHQNGMVLQNKKYKFLAIAFRTFQVGLAVTFLVFLYENRNLLAAVLGLG